MAGARAFADTWSRARSCRDDPRRACVARNTQSGACPLFRARLLADAIAWAEALETYHRDSRSGLLEHGGQGRGRCDRAARANRRRCDPERASGLFVRPRSAWRAHRRGALARAGGTNFLRRSGQRRGAISLADAGILNALDFRLRAKEIVTVGPGRRALYEAALGVPFTGRVVVDIDRPDEIPEGHPAKAQVALAGDAAAFICARRHVLLAGAGQTGVARWRWSWLAAHVASPDGDPLSGKLRADGQCGDQTLIWLTLSGI